MLDDKAVEDGIRVRKANLDEIDADPVGQSTKGVEVWSTLG